jgi:hypothetical protein
MTDVFKHEKASGFWNRMITEYLQIKCQSTIKTTKNLTDSLVEQSKAYAL